MDYKIRANYLGENSSHAPPRLGSGICSTIHWFIIMVFATNNACTHGFSLSGDNLSFIMNTRILGHQHEKIITVFIFSFYLCKQHNQRIRLKCFLSILEPTISTKLLFQPVPREVPTQSRRQNWLFAHQEWRSLRFKGGIDGSSVELNTSGTMWRETLGSSSVLNGVQVWSFMRQMFCEESTPKKSRYED